MEYVKQDRMKVGYFEDKSEQQLEWWYLCCVEYLKEKHIRRRLWKNTYFNLVISYSVNKRGNIEQGLLISFVGKSNEGSLHSFRTLTDNDR